ncbi:MAG: hypothetical protein CSB13_04470 [Chloroflexi bacterium]|nr:MAG: hypothetical protein CSB13_04470 [Chloroflexota bacterium]
MGKFNTTQKGTTYFLPKKLMLSQTPMIILGVIILSCWLSACDLLPGSETPTPQSSTPESERTQPDTESSPDIVSTPNFDLPEPTLSPQPRLNIWLPPEIASRTEAGSVIFSDQLLAFNNTNPDLIITVEQKTVSGQGGLLNYLRTGQTVAPSILPDLIALPVQQIKTVSDEGLIFPLEDVLDPASLENLYPVAQAWSTHNNHIFAYPFAITELPLLEYSSSITETPPIQWQTFITNMERTLVLPAAGSPGAKLALQFYLQAGGTLENEAGQAALELEPLTFALQQIYTARQNGFILPQSSNLSSIGEGRILVQNGTADYALSASDEFLKGRTEDSLFSFVAIPGSDESPTPLVSGWGWVITTSDPTKKAIAADLITTLSEPENLGDWSLNSKILPANPLAFAQWPSEDTFTAFANQALLRANTIPFTNNNTIMRVLEDAVFDVVSLSKTAEEAAAFAVSALQPDS